MLGPATLMFLARGERVGQVRGVSHRAPVGLEKAKDDLEPSFCFYFSSAGRTGALRVPSMSGGN